MILRRLYLYLVSAASLGLLAAGLALLGTTVLELVFNASSAENSRVQLAGYTAMAVVALPVWGLHFWFAQRFARRDPFERASALRRLYLYWACAVMSIAGLIALATALGSVLQPIMDVRAPLDGLASAQAGWAAVVFIAIWLFHFWVAARDRAAVGEQGAAATLRRWYMYGVLLIALLVMLGWTSNALRLGWSRLATGSTNDLELLSAWAGPALAALVVWGFHARTIALNHITDDRHSTLRALQGFVAVAVSMVMALVGASQILYYILGRGLGISNPGGVGSNLMAALASPGSLVLVYGVAWILIRRRLSRDAGTQEADRQAGIRRLYTNLAALVSLAAWGIGAGWLLWTLAEQLEAPLIGVSAGDWRDPVSGSVTLLVVGAGVWLAHWRHAPWAEDRQSLSRRLYVWAALLGSVLVLLGGGVGMINALLQQLFRANPRLNDSTNLDFGHFLAVIVVAAAVAIYHWRVLQADMRARPRRAVGPAAAVAAPTQPEPAAVLTEPALDGPHPRRYTLVVTDATADDIHQALASLPPQASYKLTAGEEPAT